MISEKLVQRRGFILFPFLHPHALGPAKAGQTTLIHVVVVTALIVASTT